MTPLQKAAHDIGAKGSEPTEEERLAFESWMRGHFWAVIGEWDGKQYKHAHESTGFVHGGAMNTRRLWAAWRDRGAVARVLAGQAQAVEPTGLRDAVAAVCEGWTLPDGARKMLESALWTNPSPPPAGERAVEPATGERAELIARIDGLFSEITPLPWVAGADGRGVGLAGDRWVRGAFSNVTKDSVEAFGGSPIANTRFMANLANAWPIIKTMLEADALELARLRELARDAADAATQLQKQVLLLRAQRVAVNPEMVSAYLKANDAYWKRTDEVPPVNPSRWRQGTPSEATYESLCAALATIPQMEAQQVAVPDMFWNHDDADKLYSSISEFLNDEMCSGTELAVGDIRTVQRAVRLPNIVIRITSVDEDECDAEYEIVEVQGDSNACKVD